MCVLHGRCYTSVPACVCEREWADCCMGIRWIISSLIVKKKKKEKSSKRPCSPQPPPLTRSSNNTQQLGRQRQRSEWCREAALSLVLRVIKNRWFQEMTFFGALVVCPPAATPWRLLQMLRLCNSLLLLVDDFSCGATYFHWGKAFSQSLSTCQSLIVRFCN